MEHVIQILGPNLAQIVYFRLRLGGAKQFGEFQFLSLVATSAAELKFQNKFWSKTVQVEKKVLRDFYFSYLTQMYAMQMPFFMILGQIISDLLLAPMNM